MAAEGTGMGGALDAIILAGGRGERLRSVVSDVPKPLAPVGGRPFLDYQLALLARSGRVRRAVLALGHLADKVIAHYERAPPPLPLAFVVETTLLGTGGGLRNALDLTEGAEVLALNGDSVLGWRVEPLLAARRRTGASGVLALARVDDTARYGAVALDGERITAFREKAESGGAGPINAGVYLFAREALQAIPPGRSWSLERDTLAGLAAEGRLAGVPFDGPFIDIGLPETYAAAGGVLERLGA